jgi:hypothetical protein
MGTGRDVQRVIKRNARSIREISMVCNALFILCSFQLGIGSIGMYQVPSIFDSLVRPHITARKF